VSGRAAVRNPRRAAPGACLRPAPLWAVAFLVALLCGACRPPEARTGPARPADLETLIGSLCPGGHRGELTGRGTLAAEVGERRLPVLDFRFAARGVDEARGLLKPGVLSPVLSAWAGEGGWSLHLPRQRLAFEARAERPAGAPDAGGPQAERPAALMWFLLVPADLLASLADPRVVEHEGRWIVTGFVDDLGPDPLRVELWIDPLVPGVSLWALAAGDDRQLLRAAYDRPVREVARGDGIRILLPGLDVRGTLRFTAVEREDVAPGERPDVPAGWELRPAGDLADALAALAAAGE